MRARPILQSGGQKESGAGGMSNADFWLNLLSGIAIGYWLAILLLKLGYASEGEITLWDERRKWRNRKPETPSTEPTTDPVFAGKQKEDL